MALPRFARIALVAVVPLLLALVPLRALEEAPPVCLVRLATGHSCWGCGMTRALCAMTRGEVARAVGYNPRVLIVFPLLAGAWLSTLRRTIGTGGLHGSLRTPEVE